MMLWHVLASTSDKNEKRWRTQKVRDERALQRLGVARPTQPAGVDYLFLTTPLGIERYVLPRRGGK